jgi:hypothetical protein
MTDTKMTAFVTRGGSYRIAVRWSPYWRASHGCLRQGRDGMLRLTTLRSQRVTLSFVVSAEGALDTLTGSSHRCSTPDG